MLGLSSNGTGVATEFDPKNGFRFKFGFQQSNDDAANLSDSMFTLTRSRVHVHAVRAAGRHLSRVVPHGQHAGRSGAGDVATGFGLSLDQKVTPVRWRVRAGTGRRNLEPGRDNFYSVGLGFQNGIIFNPQDTWGVGYAQMDLEDRPEGTAHRGLLQLPSDGAAAALVPPHARPRQRGYRVRVRVSAAGRAFPGGVLGTRSRSHVYITAHNPHRRGAHGRRASRPSSPRCRRRTSRSPTRDRW